MISIVIATRSLWACKILNGEKKIEVRKGLALYNALKRAEERGEEVEFLMYVTKDGKRPIYLPWEFDIHEKNGEYVADCDFAKGNGKVVAKFNAKAEVICYDHDEREEWYATRSMNERELYERSGLDYKQLDDYLQGKESTALHIRNLEPLPEPKTLADYGLKRAPQSWAYAKKGE